MKGQSAIEYLMTYGWMLLVVAIVGGAVFSVAQTDENSSLGGLSDLAIEQFGVNPVSFVWGPSAEARFIKKLNISQKSNTIEVFMREEAAEGEVLEIPVNSRGGNSDAELLFVYDKGGLTNLQESGEISNFGSIDESREIQITDIPQNETIYLPLNGDIDDNSDNEFNVTGTKNFTQGLRGTKAISLNESQSVEVEKNSSDIALGSNFSVSAWMKLDSDFSDNNYNYANLLSDESFQDSGLYFGDTNFGGESLAIRINNESSNSQARYFLQDEDIDSWIQFAGTFNQTHLVLYKNGERVDITASQIDKYHPNDNNFSVGGSNFIGEISQLRLYNRTLGQKQVNHLYEEPVTPKQEYLANN